MGTKSATAGYSRVSWKCSESEYSSCFGVEKEKWLSSLAYIAGCMVLDQSEQIFLPTVSPPPLLLSSYVCLTFVVGAASLDLKFMRTNTSFVLVISICCDGQWGQTLEL